MASDRNFLGKSGEKICTEKIWASVAEWCSQRLTPVFV